MSTLPVNRVLVVGGGIGGMAAAILLRRLGVAVDLVEVDPRWQVYGAGITLSAVTMRALVALGFAQDLQARGFCGHGMDLFAADGTHLFTRDSPRLSGPDQPSVGGIMRPVLREILADATLATGTQVRLGVTFRSITQDGQSAHVTFTDGSTGSYDLVVGADGLRSAVRQHLFPDAPAAVYTGQACWRAVVPRPGHIVRPNVYMGHRHKAGVNPVSQTEMYLFLNHPEPANQVFADGALPRELARRLSSYGGDLAVVRESLNESSRVLYRPFDKLMVPAPWYRGRVLLIGDAVHATTPHLGSGAGAAVEDALVLAEELARADSVEQALQRFMARRFERCRDVVEYSARLGELELLDDTHEEHARLHEKAMAILSAPY